MAPRKNTAEAFEVLYKIAHEEETKRKAKKAPRAGEETPEVPAESVKAAPPPPRLERQSLLAPTREPEALKRRAAARTRFARGRSSAAPRLPRELPQEPRQEPEPSLQRHEAPAPRRAPIAAATEPKKNGEVTAEERAILLEDDVVQSWSEPFSSSPVTPIPSAALAPEFPSSVDPALTGRGDPESWPDARRARFLETREPLQNPAAAAPTFSRSAPRVVALKPEPVEIALASRLPEAAEMASPEPATTSVVLSAGDSRSEPDMAPAAETVAVLGPDPASSSPREGASRALSGGVQRGWTILKRGSRWALGEGSTRWLERPVELKLSTLLVGAIAGVIVTTLALMYVGRPGEEDALFRSSFDAGRADRDARGLAQVSHPSASIPHASAPLSHSFAPDPGPPERAESVQSPEPPAESLTESASVALPTTPPEKPASRSAPAVRPIPLWGPGMSVAGEGGVTSKAPERGPDVRNVVSKAAENPAEPSPGNQLEQQPLDSRAVSALTEAGGTIYVIQVRAKESMKGAEGIIDYLALFGFDKPIISRDPRGDRSPAGEELYTVFAGQYTDRREAERECSRLKRETRATPYKSKPTYFSDCLVITRAH